ncbi:glyceraldehyde-3-phosphate dehydrogenase, type I [Ruminiclostridium papyrosolvens DSM 2782]|uniref:Glyceraldehyde-3-phosphate dehydrogenase n=1 Tax=Ruminiclostridium papyrosolvens DSM 2782 TaxID=588581 RepID=F1TCT1_9FIRM|nr:type I glyceraldehyde-3-phosphate dehydrogenase [Ruminiclostridium papyrosolvens]EGD47798.1 glyceraldehyde-3-phosphate dehydrogenase, type I [Ruminiclostridium papyrosolvens DSM 2782]WES34514.1 type I glyceraldehyde-3-phosphate dehydrogenase [Ruminiclostridium papyrosolvens DSM 2782]
MAVRIGINGFGRIGRNSFKVLLEKYSEDLEVVAINDLTAPETLAHLLKYDSVFGRYNGLVEVCKNGLKVNGRPVKILSEKDPASINWGDMGVDIVLESTGLFSKREKAQLHITKGNAKKVIISAPSPDDDITVVMGVNHDRYDAKKHNIISNASCTTNCLSPLAKVLNDNFGIVRGLMTTVHAYTNDQKILDLPHKDLRRARAANVSIIPTKTGATKAVEKVLPELAGKLSGLALRVPTFAVSVVDLVIETEMLVVKNDVNAALIEASEGNMKGILGYTQEPLVSIDFKGQSESSIVDALSTIVINDNMIKVVAWYDNEWGYSNRYADLAAFVAKKGFN